MSWMLRLYPRDWRRRYGDEVARLVASERRSFRLFLDLLAGAVDAHLHPQWTPSPSPTKGNDAMSSIRRLCASEGFTPADHRRSAVLVLGGSLGFALLGLALQLFFGQTLFSQSVLYAGFPMALILSSHSTYMKAYSRPVGWVLVIGGMVGMYLFMLAVAWVAQSL